MPGADNNDYLNPSDDEIAAAPDPMMGSDPLVDPYSVVIEGDRLPPPPSGTPPGSLDNDSGWMVGDAGAGGRHLQQMGFGHGYHERGYTSSGPILAGCHRGLDMVVPRSAHGIEVMLDRGAVEHMDVANKIGDLIAHAEALGFIARGWSDYGSS